MARVSGSWSTTVNKPASEVYAYLADPNKHGEWSPKAYHVEDLVGPIGEVGSSFTSVGWVPRDAAHRNKVTVTQAVPGQVIEFTSEDGGENFVNRFTLQADGAATVLTRSTDWPKPSGVAGVLWPVINTALVGPDINKGLGKLKANLESS